MRWDVKRKLTFTKLVLTHLVCLYRVCNVFVFQSYRMNARTFAESRQWKTAVTTNTEEYSNLSTMSF